MKGTTMMDLENVGIVIASRELTLDDKQAIPILIGKPEILPGSDDWYCPHQAAGIGSGKVRYAIGVDPVQALVLSLSMLGAELYCSPEYEAGRLNWECGKVRGNLGLPVPENIRDVFPGGKAGGSGTKD
ncbi:MAG TPA: hypothetical protein VHU23_07020 [Rhizomicrobium sp.]|jgi:hypothetical protein|nr:hypothetical protein [Rhizomicrobium sp.]